jgi:RimK family alpha-L-glutamate ligase
MKKVLILTSGKRTKLRSFKLAKKDLPIDVVTASFSEVNFGSGSNSLKLKNSIDIQDFDVIYFRLVGKSLETASLVAEYAKKHRIHIIDRIYEKSQIYPISLSKAQEMQALINSGITVPRTFFGSIPNIARQAKKEFGFPFVVKATSGSRGREVYSPQNMIELKALVNSLFTEEKSGKKFFVQEYINCTKRTRVLVVGRRVIGAITQLTKWRKRVSGYSPSEDEKKIEKVSLTNDISNLALAAVSAVGIDIAGVDILLDDKTNKLYVIEVNAAPSWKLIKKYCKVNVEYEILKFVSG